MDADLSATCSLDRQPSHGYASSDADSKPAPGGSSKKRASRAGTRSVTTLSTAQLERKRANDREAQRAIRQRTKDHIEILERTVSELRGSNESSEKIVAVTRQRNRELEEENAFLRNRLNDAGYHNEASTTEADNESRAFDFARRTAFHTWIEPAADKLHIESSKSFGGDCILGLSSWIVPTGSSSMSTPTPLTAWRSHEGMPSGLHEGSTQQSPSYHLSEPGATSTWTPTSQQYQYASGTDPQRHQQYEPQPPAAASQHYAPAPVMPYNPVHTSTVQHPPYHPPQLPPQAEFQNMAVSSPAAYHVSHAQSYQPSQPQAPFANQQHGLQINSMQMSAAGNAYSPSHGQMQPPPIPATSYTSIPDRQYTPQQAHPPLQYPQDSSRSGYGLTHYPPG
ncbi:hypothetical protein LTR62_006437 [Meristemomyces frigidus]|uniref:BZIP domain-containing protein n=1 Tax=Meristemomyces frigidus TaxID=1508187 RepID=A0AAN7TDI4_9PEZI|nr:hypothetical protein LTR62_006437 [Meristemomyces frigidus]